MFKPFLAPVIDISSSEAPRQQMEELQAPLTELLSETLPSDALQLEPYVEWEICIFKNWYLLLDLLAKKRH